MGEKDNEYIRLALRLAERGRGYVEPNPMVGAVIVRGGRIIGKGWHRRFGGAHAEVNAINDAGGQVVGSTVYVTLEPCGHIGKTPPCVEFLIAHKVRRVVIACRDNCFNTSGQSVLKLKSAGIAVEENVLNGEARELNAPFFKRIEQHLPYVIAKWAMTLDGKLATRSGDSKWISSDSARRFVQEMRGRMDAIIIGVGTAIADDPELTCRLARARRVAARVVLDPEAGLSTSSKLVKTTDEAPLIVAVAATAPKRRVTELELRGCEIMRVPCRAGQLDVKRLLHALCARGATNVLVEGGGRTLGSFFDAGVVDEVAAFVSPKILGAGISIEGAGFKKLSQAAKLESLRTRRFGDTILLSGRIG